MLNSVYLSKVLPSIFVIAHEGTQASVLVMWRRNQKQPLDSRAIFCSQKPPDEVINLFLEGCRLWGKAENTQSGVLLPLCFCRPRVWQKWCIFRRRRGSQKFPFTSFSVRTSSYPPRCPLLPFLSSVIPLQMTRAPLKHMFGLWQSNSPICKLGFETQYEDFQFWAIFVHFLYLKISRLSKSSSDVRLFFEGNFFFLSPSK